LRRDAIARFEAAADQHVRHLAGTCDQLAIADALPVEGLDRKPVRIVEAIEQA
jgi:hypothetical protein